MVASPFTPPRFVLGVLLIAAPLSAQLCGTPGLDKAKGCWDPPFKHLDADDGVGTFLPDGTPITDPTQCTPGWPLKSYGKVVSTNPLEFAAETTTALHMSLIPVGTKRDWVIVWGEPLVHTVLTKTQELPVSPFPLQGRYPWPSNLGLDPTEYNVQAVRQHQYAIFDPADPANTWMNFCVDLPPNAGDLFCAGHAWTANGNLLVAGGTIGWEHARKDPNEGFEGSRLCYLWIPPDASNPGGQWVPQPDLFNRRWYPSVMALGPDVAKSGAQQDLMVVLGGIEDGGPNPQYAVDSYQVWVPPTASPFAGTWETHQPSNTKVWPGSSTMLLENYPRAVLLSSGTLGTAGLGQLVFGGWPQTTDVLDQYGGASWLQDGMFQMTGYREYGSIVLLPIVAGSSLKDRAFVPGGLTDDATPVILDSVQQRNGALANPTWQSRASMPVGLWTQNTVLTPDGRVVVLGGERSDVSPVTGNPGYTGGEGFCTFNPNFTPFEYDPTRGDNYWRTLNDHQMIRDYHSTGILLPSGKILVGGGEHRKDIESSTCPPPNRRGSGPWDYELYTPYYLSLLNDPGSRLVITPHPTGEFSFAYSQDVTIGYGFDTSPAPGFTVDRVVLVRPGSTTHHSDGNQRVVQVNFMHVSDSTIRVTVPSLASGILPRGVYMLFLLSLQDGVLVPSVAQWARVT